MKKSEKTEHTVARIIEAATNEFGKLGYAGGTINRICQAGKPRPVPSIAGGDWGFVRRQGEVSLEFLGRMG